MAGEARFRRHGSRYKARSRAVEILFEAEARDVDPVATVQDRRELSRRPEPVVPPVNEYTATIVEGVAVDLDGIDNLIASNLAQEWSLERIPAVDRAILRVACWEIIRNPEVPVQAAVVSAIEMAESYSTTVAPPYINGVLDTISALAESARSGETDPFAVPETPFAEDDSEAESPFGDVEEFDDTADHDAFGVDVDSVLAESEWDELPTEPGTWSEQAPAQDPAAPGDAPAAQAEASPAADPAVTETAEAPEAPAEDVASQEDAAASSPEQQFPA